MSECSVCADARRAEIDARLIHGIGIRVVGKEFGIPKSTLADHASARHHASALAGTAGTEDGAALMQVLRETMDAARTLAKKAVMKGDLRVAVSALAEVGRCGDLLQRAQLDNRGKTEASRGEIVANICALFPKVLPMIVAEDPDLLQRTLERADVEALRAELAKRPAPVSEMLAETPNVLPFDPAIS